MARLGRRRAERRASLPGVAGFVELEGVPSLADRIAQEDALQEFVQSVPGPEDELEDDEDMQEALDDEGVDPEELDELDELDETVEVSPELAGMLEALSRPEPEPLLSPQQVEAERGLDARAPMSEEAQRAVEMLVRRSGPLPDVRPRMSRERLEMRIRIPARWQAQHPKRPGTIAHANWLMYVDGMTVSAYLATHDRRRARSDLQWDLDHEFVYLQTPQEYAEEVALEAEGREEGV